MGSWASALLVSELLDGFNNSVDATSVMLRAQGDGVVAATVHTNSLSLSLSSAGRTRRNIENQTSEECKAGAVRPV